MYYPQTDWKRQRDERKIEKKNKQIHEKGEIQIIFIQSCMPANFVICDL